MYSTEIRKVIDTTFSKPMAGWSTESLQSLAVWEIAYQLAVANEREALMSRRQALADLTVTPSPRLDATPVPFMPSYPMPFTVPYSPTITPTITCSKPLASGNTACQSDWIQTTNTSKEE